MEENREVLQLIETLYTMVSDAWGVPLGNEKCIVERDKVLNVLDRIKDSLPTELAEAKRLMTSRDEYIQSAREEADSIRRAAQDEADRLLNQQEIVRIAREQSEHMVAVAERRSQDLYRAANSYIDERMRLAEDSMSAAFNEIRQAHGRFREAAGYGASVQSAPAANAVQQQPQRRRQFQQQQTLSPAQAQPQQLQQSQLPSQVFPQQQTQTPMQSWQQQTQIPAQSWPQLQPQQQTLSPAQAQPQWRQVVEAQAGQSAELSQQNVLSERVTGR